LEALTQPGGICISGKVFDEITGKLTFEHEDLGLQQLKNIAVPVRAYRLRQCMLPTTLSFFPKIDPVFAGRPSIAGPPVADMLQLVGPVSLRSEGQDIPLRSPKVRALLGYVALGESFRETRTRLLRLLWSDAGNDRARASALRKVVRELRNHLEAAGCSGIISALMKSGSIQTHFESMYSRCSKPPTRARCIRCS